MANHNFSNRPNSLDAAETLDCDTIEQGWKDTLEARENLDRDTERAFREGQRVAPSSVVGSAEGPMLFPGFGSDEYGQQLQLVARASLAGTFDPESIDLEAQSRED